MQVRSSAACCWYEPEACAPRVKILEQIFWVIINRPRKNCRLSLLMTSSSWFRPFLDSNPKGYPKLSVPRVKILKQIFWRIIYRPGKDWQLSWLITSSSWTVPGFQPTKVTLQWLEIHCLNLRLHNLPFSRYCHLASSTKETNVASPNCQTTSTFHWLLCDCFAAKGIAQTTTAGPISALVQEASLLYPDLDQQPVITLEGDHR